MKQGVAYKNLTDSIVLIAAIIALICVLLSVISFEESYVVKDPITHEDVEVAKPLEDPYNITFIKLFAIFSITAIVGFIARKWALISTVASVCSIVIAFTYFLDGSSGELGFIYVFCGIVGLAGNIILMVISEQERKTEFKEMVGIKRRERLEEKGRSKKK